MPIDKITPKYLSSDSDNKLVPKNAMLDAMNVYLGGDDFDSLDNGDPNITNYSRGDGILKSIKGNQRVIPYSPDEKFPLGGRVLGSVEDTKTKILYLFVWAPEATDQGVWAYDSKGVLPDSTPGTLRLIYKSAQFNFPDDGFVKGDVVYSNAVSTFNDLGDDFDKDAIVYFTDGTNEPRKINAYRAFSVGGSSIHGNNIYAEADFITACPKTPVEPIVFNFSSDPTKTTNAFIGKSGYQFAYQYIYNDGMESAISCYSDVAFPPSVITQGANSYVDHSFFNRCSLTIPEPGPEINAVKILAREGNTGSFSYIDEISVQQLSDLEGVYEFYNNRVLIGVSSDEVNKQFDYLPKKAEAQSVSSNRMMYGNYLEGFDAVETECSSVVFYMKRKEDFLSFAIKAKPAILKNQQQSDEMINLTVRKTAGFNIDVSELPDTYDANTEVFLSLTFAPERSWNVYNSDKSYHQSRNIGEVDQTLVTEFMTGINSDPELQESEEAGDYILSEGFPVLCKNIGVGSHLKWRVVADNGGAPVGTELPTTIGTSAGHPLILSSSALTFKVKFLVTDAVAINGRTLALDVIKKVFTLPLEEAQESVDNLNWPVTILEGNHEWDSEINLAIDNGETIPGNYFGDSPSSPSSKLICCAGQAADTGQFETEATIVAPDGYFIVNKADLKFSLDLHTSTDNSASFTFLLEEVKNIEVVTALKVWEAGVGNWVALSSGYAQDILVGAQNVNDISETYNENDFNIGTLSNSRNQIGYLVFSDENSINPLYNADDSDIFCLFDGEGGPAGGKARGGESGLEYDTLGVNNHPSVSYNMLYNGNIKINNDATNLPLINQSDTFPLPFASTEEDEETHLNVGAVNFSRFHSHVEILENQTYIDEENPNHRSFKTNADHDFGIVYYDERGRHGFANHLQTVFVKGYDEAERGYNAQGRVEISLKLIHPPPEWAFHYKIVYAKNTSWGDYVQYSSGGAFAIDSPQEITTSNQNLYISLNYLQGHPISYVSSWGARTPEGGLNFVKNTKESKLRVISYSSGDDREYAPSSYEFDVIEMVKLGNDAENPLSDEPVQENQVGDFLVVKNNPHALGFSYTDVISNSDFWRNNCIVEILTPLEEQDIDKTLYYELPGTYRVANNEFGELIHEENPILLSDGDVWFRKVAVNVREKEAGTFVDIILNDDGDDVESVSNFKSVYLESKSANDLFRSDSYGLGRPNVVSDDASETRREATITYSDPSNPESTKINYSSFNGSLANFKDLPETYKGIDYLADQDGYMFVLQGNKSSLLPVDKNVLSDASGNQTIIASRKVLGEAKFYPGSTGSDGSPESVSVASNNIFFANKSLGKIYRFNASSGIEVISDVGMAATLRKSFRDAIEDVSAHHHLKIVGGYDPVKEEYLITILPGIPNRDTANVVLVGQPSTGTAGPDGGFGGGGGGDEDNDADGGDLIPPKADSSNESKELQFEMIQDAIDYINRQAGSADPADHMNRAELQVLISNIVAKNPEASRIIIGSLEGEVDQKERNQSVYVEPPSAASRAAQIPQPKQMPPWKTTQQALDYIHSVGTMNIEEFLYFRSFLRDQVVMSANGLSVTTQDLLVMLSLFGANAGGPYGNPQDSAYNSSFTGGGATLTYSIMDAINFIIQAGDMTAAQYTAWQNASSTTNTIAPIIRSDCRMDGDETKTIGTSDFIIFLGAYTASAGTTQIDPESLAFNF